MKGYSLRRRLIAAALLLECALTAGMTAVTLGYVWIDQTRALDATLRGRADSLLGAVHDAEDPGDNVAIDPEALDLPSGDFWMAQDARGPVLAHSRAWTNGAETSFGMKARPHDLRIGGAAMRGLILRGVRQIDADDTSPGIARPVVIYYAASLAPVYHGVYKAARFLVLANLLLLLLTGTALALLLRRGLAPLGSLSLAAAEMTPVRPRFRAPEHAFAVAELAPLAGALESATRRLDEAFRQQQVFVHDAAHELKTAVTIVKSSLQLLSSRPRSTREYASGLETCLTDCARMEDLVQRMLQLARFERGPAAPGDHCDLAEAAREVSAQMERLAEIRGVGISLEAPSPAPVPLSEDACGSLLANLLLNAVQHTPAGGSVSARIATADSSVVLEVRDTGSGIAAEDLPHLFERFWRGDRSRARSTGGVGLGLSICKAIVDSCGGAIKIASAPDKGTAVTVRLPLAPAPDAHPKPSRQPEPALHS
jgi:signal transduction histidine kinase